MGINRVYGAITLIGGSEGALDTIKYAVLSDGDLSIVSDDTEETHIFRFESSSALTENSPQVIAPDDIGVNNGRWILTDMSVEDLKAYGDVVFDQSVSITGATTVSTLTASGLVTANTLKVGTGATVTTIDNDDTLLADSDTRLCTQGNTKAYVDTVIGGGSIVLSYDLFAGFVIRPHFTYVSTTAITVGSFRHHHDGTSEQVVKADSDISYTLSNMDYSVSEFSYLYLDDSAIVTAGTNIISATELIDSTTAPTWSSAKHGWYNGNDKCIGAFSVNSSDLLETFHHRDNFMGRGADYNNVSGFSTSWTSITIKAPSFSTLAQIGFEFYNATASSNVRLNCRPSGSTASGWEVGYILTTSGGESQKEVIMPLSSSQQIEIVSSNGNGTYELTTKGWFFPRGM